MTMGDGGSAARRSGAPTSARSCRRCTPRGRCRGRSSASAPASRAAASAGSSATWWPPARRRGRGESLGAPGRPSPLVHLDPERAVVLALEIAVDSLAVAVVGLGGHVLELVRVDRPRGHLTPTTSSPTSSSSPSGVAPLAGAATRSSGSASRSSASSAATTASCRRRRTSAGATSPLGAALAAALGTASADRRRQRGRPRRPGRAPARRRGRHRGRDLPVRRGRRRRRAHRRRSTADRRRRLRRRGRAHPGQPARRRDVPVRLGRLLGDRGGRGGAARRGPAGQPTAAAPRSRRSSPTPPPAMPRRWPPLDEVGRWLGIGLAGLVNMLNPARVVLGGHFARLHPFIAATIAGTSSTARAGGVPRARRDRAGDARRRRRAARRRRAGARAASSPIRRGLFRPDGRPHRRVHRSPKQGVQLL